jgi:hypothetical protein
MPEARYSPWQDASVAHLNSAASNLLAGLDPNVAAGSRDTQNTNLILKIGMYSLMRLSG